LSPSLSYGSAHSDDNTGGGSESESYSVGLGFFWGAFENENFWLDSNINYTNSEVDSDAVGAAGQSLGSIDYDTRSFSMGLGLNSLTKINDQWQLNNRLGWSGSWNHTDSFVDVVNIKHKSEDNDNHRLTASGRIVRLTDWGQLSASAALRYVASDDSGSNSDADPWDMDLGMGFLFHINDSASLTGQLGGVVGRDNYDELNASIKIEANF
jgi:hypothetical protein